MNDKLAANFVADLSATGHIDAADVRKLQELRYAEQSLTIIEAKLLQVLSNSCPYSDPIWLEFYANKCADFIIARTDKTEADIIKDTKCFLKLDASADNNITAADLTLIVRLLEKCDAASAEFIDFFRRCCGIYINQKNGSWISKHNTQLFRRMLVASERIYHAGIQQSELQYLLQIHTQTNEEENHPIWTELLLRILIGYIKKETGIPAVSRARLLPESMMSIKDTADYLSIAGALSKRSLCFKTRAIANDRSGAADGARRQTFSANNLAWLAHYIGRDGELTKLDLEILNCVKNATPRLPIHLAALLDRSKAA